MKRHCIKKNLKNVKKISVAFATYGINKRTAIFFSQAPKIYFEKKTLRLKKNDYLCHLYQKRKKQVVN